MANEKKGVYVEYGDLCRMLIESCRYGYARNNHLMPWGAFQQCRKYVGKLGKASLEWASHTVRQLCEECISAMCSNFPNGYDVDSFGMCNRSEYVEFIEWCLSWLTERGQGGPYNVDSYLENLALDDERVYVAYDADTGEQLVDEGHAMGLNEAKDWVFAPFKDRCVSVTFNSVARKNEDGTLDIFYRNFSEPWRGNVRLHRFSTRERKRD